MGNLKDAFFTLKKQKQKKQNKNMLIS